MNKIKRPFAYLVILLALFVQIFISSLSWPAQLKPNLMIVITVFFALFTDKKFGLEAGLASGMLLDIFSIRFFGLNAVLFALGGYLVGKFNTKFYRENIITHIVIIFSVSFFILLLYFIFLNLQSQDVPFEFGFSTIIESSVILPSLINAFLGIWIFAFLSRVFRLDEDLL